MITPDLQAKLDRAAILRDKLRTPDPDFPDIDSLNPEEREEYWELVEQLTPVFLPIVHSLTRAGIITVFVDMKGQQNQDVTRLLVYPHTAHENGGIQVNGNWDGSGATG